MEPTFKEPVNRVMILQYLIDYFKLNSYLEIGVQGKFCWNQIKCDNKVGVEPCGDFTDHNIYKMNSDEFFKINNSKFDLIFIDGDHNEPQVTRDINNSLKRLNSKGLIVMHDAFPPEERFTEALRCGTVFKSIWAARCAYNLDILTYTGDFGVAVMKPNNKSPRYNGNVGNYHQYISASSDLLNACDYYEDFKEKCSGLFKDH